MDDPFTPIFEQLFEQYGECTGINGSIETPGFLNVAYSVIKDFFVKVFGAFVVELKKIYDAVAELPNAIAKALTGELDVLTDLVEEKIQEPYDKFTEILSNTKNWVVDNFLEFYNNIIVPLPAVTLHLILFDIELPANQAWNDMEDDSLYKNFDPATIISFITEFLMSSLNLVLGKINDIIDPIIAIITFDIPNLEAALQELIEYFANLVNPLLDILDKFLEGIIKVFNKVGSDVVAIKNQILAWLIEKIPLGEIDFDDLPEEVKLIAKFCYCLFRLIFNFLVLLFTFNF